MLHSHKKATQRVAGVRKEEKDLSWHRAIFARRYHLTIVAAAAFHNRVRDGSVWFHSAMNTRKYFYQSRVHLIDNFLKVEP
jgi:hypothetical protein